MNTVVKQRVMASPTAAAERLPCRGCTRDCSNYATCDGRPWAQVHDKSKVKPT